MVFWTHFLKILLKRLSRLCYDRRIDNRAERARPWPCPPQAYVCEPFFLSFADFFGPRCFKMFNFVWQGNDHEKDKRSYSRAWLDPLLRSPLKKPQSDACRACPHGSRTYPLSADRPFPVGNRCWSRRAMFAVSRSDGGFGLFHHSTQLRKRERKTCTKCGKSRH